MKESELRLGNLLQDGRSKAILIVCRIEIGIITTIVKDREKYPLADGWYNEPIPLTEKILFDLGGERFPDGQSISLNHHLFQFMECRNVFIHVATSVEVPFVHTLQNLLFALTANELKTKNLTII